MTASTTVGAPRDLNRNGAIDPYEDPSRPIEERVADLLARMTLVEKAGLMFHTLTPLEGGGFPDRPSVEDLIQQRGINHFNVMGSGSGRVMAEWANRMQAFAAETRLGIPISISSDPRHGYADNPGAGFAANDFSQWPEPIGFGAIGDPDLVQLFAGIARQEYRAAGISMALHPMADLATEPRWSRINGTFGEDAHLAARLVGAYVRGFQGETLGPRSVACVTKHFPGGGPELDGEDSHFPYGREQVYPGGNFDGHLIPFEAAFAAGTAQIMPYYSMPIGLDLEEVGFSFNRQVVTGLLRERYGFDGVICTDWGILSDSLIFGKVLPARAWGAEHLTIPERARKALEAGIDQFGGEHCPEVIVDLVERGLVEESRLDLSVARILRDKFRLGLFDEPYVDPDVADEIVGRADFRAAGAAAQRRAIVLLKNGAEDGDRLLPLSGRVRIYAEGIEAGVAAEYGDVVGDPGSADVAILRLQTPFEPRDSLPLETFFHSGSLAFSADEIARIRTIAAVVPTVIEIFLERPAVFPEIAGAANVVLGSFGASDRAVLDIIFGRHPPTGKLPFELPSSMDAVRDQHPDLPHDSRDPLFPFGFGLTYQ